MLFSDLQGPGPQADCLLGSETHGPGGVWVRVRGCSGPPHELCMA